MTKRKIAAKLQELAKQYPEKLRSAQLRDVQRIAFHISLVLNELGWQSPDQFTTAGLGGYSQRGMRAVTELINPVLRWFPQLCSDICLVGKKPL